MSRLSAVRPAYWISGVLLVVAVVVPLLVPTYAKPDPHLWGFPFFYWYQLMWVFLSAILVSISYRLLRAEERRRRAAQGLGDPDAPDAADGSTGSAGSAGPAAKEGEQ